MADGSANLVAPWKPGQTGNPGGSSKKQRARKKLREAVAAVLETTVPEEIRAKLCAAMGMDIAGETICDLIAARLAALALGQTQGVALGAIHEIASLEPKVQEHQFPDGVPERAERFATPDEHREKLQEILEVPDDATLQ